MGGMELARVMLPQAEVSTQGAWKRNAEDGIADFRFGISEGGRERSNAKADPSLRTASG
jgi:hypothetical protein